MLAQLHQHLHVIALWDEAWQCYNNAYLLRRGARLILIDCGKAEQGAALLDALATLGISPEDVTDLVATHRHADHVGSAARFSRARRWIHPADWAALTPELQALFAPALPDDLVWRLTGFHTPGSVALYDAQAGALLIGDHICFPGLPLGEEGLVAASPAVFDQAAAYVGGWADSDGTSTRFNFELFRSALELLSEFPTRYLCTGHGVVLAGDIPAFLQKIRG